jgi:hypothetical protein
MYEADRAFIREGLGRYQQSKPVTSALALAESTLEYVPDYGWTWQYDLEKRMAILRGAGVTPLNLIQRVAEHYALVERQPHLFKVQRSQHMALARHVLRLTKLGRWRPGTRLLISLGGMLAEDLGAFAIQLLRRLQTDLAERQALRRSAADFDSIEGISK